MDREELTKRLLEDEPNARPGLWKKLRPERDAMPDALKDALRAQIASTDPGSDDGPDDRSGAGKFPRRFVMLGAAALLLIALGAGYILLRDSGPRGEIAFTFARGTGHRMLHGKQTALGKGSVLKAGETFSLEKDASAAVGLAGRGIAYFQGPGRFVFETREKDAANGPGEIHLRVLEGRASILSGGEKIVWRTAKAVYRMTGTAGRLSVSSAGEKLEVLEGSFLVHRAGTTIAVEAGRALDGESPRALTPAEARGLRVLRERLEAVRQGRPFIDASVSLTDDDSIREFYGIIHETILKDGRRYSGYAVRRKNLVRIHTAFGVVNLKASDVAEIRSASAAR